MKTLLSRSISFGGIALVAVLPSVSAQVLDISRIIAQDDFNSYSLGSRPTAMTNGLNMLWNPEIVADSSNLFGGGTDNRFLSVYKTRHISLPFALGADSAPVVRVSFDMVFRNNPADTFNGTPVGTDAQWMGIDFRSGTDSLPESTTRSHITQFTPFNTNTRGTPTIVSAGNLNAAIQFDLFLNNTNADIVHLAPDGLTEVTLLAQNSSIWTNGSVLVANFVNARTAGTVDRPIHTILFQIDSNTTRIVSFDLDNVVIYGAIPEPSTCALFFGLIALGGAAIRRRRGAR
jgi:hypothetical protein